MAESHEALAQLARLLGDDSLRAGTSEAVQAAIDTNFGRLVYGLLGEAADSDDVTDRESALSFLESRLAFMENLLRPDQRKNLYEAVALRMDAW
jgi:hypothetical protein